GDRLRGLGVAGDAQPHALAGQAGATGGARAGRPRPPAREVAESGWCPAWRDAISLRQTSRAWTLPELVKRDGTGEVSPPRPPSARVRDPRAKCNPHSPPSARPALNLPPPAKSPPGDRPRAPWPPPPAS